VIDVREECFASELLFSFDYTVYRAQDTRLCSEKESSKGEEKEK